MTGVYVWTGLALRALPGGCEAAGPPSEAATGLIWASGNAWGASRIPRAAAKSRAEGSDPKPRGSEGPTHGTRVGRVCDLWR